MKASELGIRESDGVTDDVLAARLRAGDPEAMGEIYDRYADRIYNFCFRRTASWSVAEDAMAAAFLEVWRVRGRAVAYDGELLPWLYGVAGNVCRNSLRSQRRQTALGAKLHLVEGGVHEDDHADAVAGRVDDERRMAELVAAVEQLPEPDQQILMLVAWDGLTYQQAAEVIGVPVGTVRSRLSRSRTRLAELMSRSDEERNR
ncbi:RNA polymerase sigma factor [Nocardioides immobilis]|uniref:RNA polymerase sigma factor n=1 Tax=Nocardioides immobilis TaxID=2049295 RepID=A0A417Y3E3_9ACTN|nr:RNA polymerase sigma factor [Nocardioides immobilis]RHW27179.1 RNA polymerase sigma factor [Nocardioides immobilis]